MTAGSFLELRGSPQSQFEEAALAAAPENPYLLGQDATTLNSTQAVVDHYIAQGVDFELLFRKPTWDEGGRLSDDTGRAYRRIMTAHDPLLFALVYCADLITNDDSDVAMGDMHIDFCRSATAWAHCKLSEYHREVKVAPRGSGKSTWWFTILPLWASAHCWASSKNGVKGPFIVFIGASFVMAQTHIDTIRNIIGKSAYLRHDFPDLVARADEHSMFDFYLKNGTAMVAKGADQEIHGIIAPDGRRPSLIIIDDMEPKEYGSDETRDKFVRTLQNITHLARKAWLVMIGTSNSDKSLIHQAVMVHTGEVDEGTYAWIDELRMRIGYWTPFTQTTDEHGVVTRRSSDPSRWPLEVLEEEEESEDFRTHMMNLPGNPSGLKYFTNAMFTHTTGDNVYAAIAVVDPAVTENRWSDSTAYAVLGLDAVTKQIVILEVLGVKATGPEQRELALGLTDQYPVRMLKVEKNNGGNRWRDSVFTDMPVPVDLFSSSRSKDERIRDLSKAYSLRNNGVPVLVHAKRLTQYENQAVSWRGSDNDKKAHDDMLDAVAKGVEVLLNELGGGTQYKRSSKSYL